MTTFSRCPLISSGSESIATRTTAANFFMLIPMLSYSRKSGCRSTEQVGYAEHHRVAELLLQRGTALGAERARIEYQRREIGRHRRAEEVIYARVGDRVVS